MKNYTKGTIFVLIGAILWGMSGNCAQHLFQYENIPVNWLVTLRLTLAGAIMLIICFIKQGKHIFDIFKNKKDTVSLLIFGIFGMMCCQYTYFYTISLSDAGTATVLQYLGPALIMLVVCVGEKRFPKIYENLALVCALSGVFMLATHGNIGSMALDAKVLAWGIASAFTVVIYTLWPGRIIKKYGTVLITAWGTFIGGIPLFIAYRPFSMGVEVNANVVLFMTIIIVFGTIAAFNLYLMGVKLTEPAKASMLACVEPVSAAVITAVFLHTKFAYQDIIGFALILSAVIIINIANVFAESKNKA